MSEVKVDEWDPSEFATLKTLLVRVTSSQVPKSIVTELHRHLERAVPWILQLTQFPQPSPAERQDTEKNPIVLPSGTSWHVNDAVLAEAVQLSEALQISTRLAAVLIIHADASLHLYSGRDRVQTACFLLYAWTSDLFDFLYNLFELTISRNAEQDPPFDTLRDRVRDMLQRRVKVGSGEGTMVDLILNQLDELQKKLAGMVGTGRTVGDQYEVLQFRIRATREQQGKMVGLLALIAQGDRIGRGHLVKLLKWLKKSDRMDGLVTGVLAVFYYVVQPVDSIPEDEARSEIAEEWCHDAKFLKAASQLVFSEDWTVPKLREAVRISWSLYIYSTIRHGSQEFTPDFASGHLQDAINNDAFEYLKQLVIAIRQERGLEPQDEIAEASRDALVKLATSTDSNNDAFIFTQFQVMIEALVARRNFLRQLRNKEEDFSLRKSQTSTPARHFSSYLELAALVYRSLPVDSASSLWQQNGFTSAILENRNRPSEAVWELLSAISRGPQCSEQAFAVLENSNLSFGQLTEFYKFYVGQVPKLFESMKSSKPPQAPHEMDKEDARYGIGLTRLWTTIVSNSPVRRQLLLAHKPFQLFFDLINGEIPLELKVAAVDCAAAFCIWNEADTTVDTISRAVDSLASVSFDIKVDSLITAKRSQNVGWLHKLNNTQSIDDPQLARAYIRFLTTLLPGAAKQGTVAVVTRREAEYVFRQMSILRHQRFLRESQRWEMLDEELAFVEKALATFDMSGLLAFQDQSAYAIAKELYQSPGFVVLSRILADGDFKPFELLAGVVDAVPQMERTSILTSVLSRVLRIFYRILDIQTVFTEILLPALERSLPAEYGFRRPANIQTLDLRLLNHLRNVTGIALLVNDSDHSISLISTKIISALASSPHFNQADRFGGEYTRTVNRLAGIVDASDESIRIAQGFCNKLDGESADLAPDQVEQLEKDVLRGEIKPEDIQSLPLVIRSNILDLLLEGTAFDATGPNIAHFLLGFEFKGHHFHLQDANESDSRYSCLQVVLKQLRGDSNAEDDLERPMDESTLVEIHPVLAAKSARLVYQLFLHSVTGKPTMSYAMSTENYSASQLRLLPARCPVSTGLAEGIVQYPEGHLVTTAETLIAYLDFQRWIVSSVALETHAFDGKAASVETVATRLFGSNTQEGSTAIIIDMLSNIDLTWHEPVEEERQLEFFTGFNFDQYKRPDVDHWDIRALRRALKAKRTAASRNANAQAVDEEVEYIVQRLSIRNRQTEVDVAKGALLAAWAELLKVALGRLFLQYLPEERQENVLFELLDALLERVSGDISPGVLDILAESVLITMSTLRMVMSEYDGLNLPVDLLANVLSKLISTVIRSGTTENARGNLYAAISQYLSLLSVTSSIPDEVSVAASTIGRDVPSSLLQRATMAVIGSRKDRFLSTLSRDAMDVRDVWKTECFALLGSLVGACVSERDRQVLSPLFKDGYLALFVRSIKDREIALQECLSPEAETLHAYWVFESKMAFLLAVATTRRGAEDLLDAGIFEIFSMCSFIAVQPYAEDTFEQTEAISRQHRVLICILQLLSRTLASLHKSPRSGAGHALSFFNAHRDSIVLVLRETQQSPTVIGIEESQLIVSILGMIIHKVPEEDRKNIASYGAYHLAALSLAARFFDPYWSEGIEEEDKAQLNKSVFTMNQIILAYLCAATAGLKAGGGYPVFLNGSQITNGGAQNISTTPTLQLVAQLLDGLVERLQDTIEEHEKAAEGGVTDLEVLRQADIGTLDMSSGDLSQVSPDHLKVAYAQSVQKTLNMVESVLLLLWRHLLFFANNANPDPIRPDNLSISLTASRVDSSRSAAGQMRALKNVAADLRGTLQRLSDVEIPTELSRPGARSEAYFGMLTRRLGELTAGLVGETTV